MIDDGGEKDVAVALGLGQLGFQLIAEGHETVHFGDDAFLFGEGREGQE